MAGNIVVFDPVAPKRDEPRQARRALDGLAGKVVGFVDNGKPNFNHLVDDLAELLKTRYGVKSAVKHGKYSASVPAPDEVMEDLARRCDLVVTGAGD